jgi:CRP/FNR family transcriptional regulator, cyclic AMP receptor protein
VSEGRFEKGGEAADRAYRPGQETGEVKEIPVIAGNVRWERPTTRSFWNALADPEREALAAAGVEQIFRAGSVLCREGDESSQVMIIDSGWVKVSVKVNAGAEAREEILAIRGQGDVVGERAALTTQVRSATVTALDEVSAMVVPAERFAEFLRGHPRAAEVLQRQIIERREEDRTRLSLGEPAGAERRLAWLLLDLARRRGGYQQVSSAIFTLPVSQQELADWAGTSPDTVGRFLRSWRERGIIARSDRARRLTVVDLDGLAAMCGAAPAAQPRTAASHAVTGQLLAEVMGELDPDPEARTRPAELEAREVLGSPGTLAEADRPVTPASAETGHAQGGTQRPDTGRNVPAWLEVSGEPLNCSVLFTDVAGFGAAFPGNVLVWC